MARFHTTFTMETLHVPRDDEDDRFIKSFTVEQIQSGDLEAMEFFDEFGFLVARDALTRDECKATLNEMFSYLEANVSGFQRDDQSTWSAWQSRSFGMPCADPLFTPQILRNRQNARIYNVFHSLIYGPQQQQQQQQQQAQPAAAAAPPHLLVNHDRWTIYRPTKAVGDEYRTRDNIHLDINPWRFSASDRTVFERSDRLKYSTLHDFISENNHVVYNIRGVQLQAVLNIVTNYEADGGFAIVPGFHRRFDEWVASLGAMTDPECRYSFPASHPISKLAIRVSCRAGSLIVWDQRCAHGSFGNRSLNMRCAQFMKMFSSEGMPDRRKRIRRDAVLRAIRQADFEDQVTDIGRIVFGLDD